MLRGDAAEVVPTPFAALGAGGRGGSDYLHPHRLPLCDSCCTGPRLDRPSGIAAAAAPLLHADSCPVNAAVGEGAGGAGRSSKEHCLVGYKGAPQLNRGVDTDVVVAEVSCAAPTPLPRLKPRHRCTIPPRFSQRNCACTPAAWCETYPALPMRGAPGGVARGSSAVRWHKHCAADVPFSHEGVLTCQVRETSRKPDEMYSLLERLSPGTRKLVHTPPPPPPPSLPLPWDGMPPWGVRKRKARVGTWSAETRENAQAKAGLELVVRSPPRTFKRVSTAWRFQSDNRPPASTILKHAGKICGTWHDTSIARPLRAGDLCPAAQLPARLGGAGQPAGGQQHQGPGPAGPVRRGVRRGQEGPHEAVTGWRRVHTMLSSCADFSTPTAFESGRV